MSTTVPLVATHRATFDVSASLQQAWDQVVAHAPAMASGLTILLLGWLLAVVLRGATARLLGATRVDTAISETRLGRMLEAFGEGMTPSRALAGFVYVGVLLLALMAAADVMGLTAVGTAINAALAYMPTVVSALVIVAVGAYAAGAARKAVGAVLTEMRSAMSGPLQTATELSILGLALLVAANVLGVDTSFITSGIGLVVGMVLAATGFLFAWSMRRPAEEIIANYYLRRMVQLGDEIELGEVSGTAERFCPLGVMVRDAAGVQHFVPARHVLAGLRRRSSGS